MAVPRAALRPSTTSYLRLTSHTLSIPRRPTMHASPTTTSLLPPTQALTQQHQQPQQRRRLTVPPEAWDTHIHVAEPARFPPSTSATYKVHAAPLSAAITNSTRLSLPNIVFVQTSTYGTNNAWILDCLARVKESTTRQARGIVVLEPESAEANLVQLREWDSAGVRGLRLNFASVGREVSVREIATLLRAYAELIRPLRRWGLHLYIPLGAVPGITYELVDELGVRIVVDHMGNPPGLAAPMGQYAGWSELLTVLEHPDVFVKISAPYRFTKDAQFKDLETPVKELMAVRNGDAVVFASDWPHTRFEDTDIKPWVDRCLEWCNNDETLATKLFRSNAERLFDPPS